MSRKNEKLRERFATKQWVCIHRRNHKFYPNDKWSIALNSMPIDFEALDCKLIHIKDLSVLTHVLHGGEVSVRHTVEGKDVDSKEIDFIEDYDPMNKYFITDGRYPTAKMIEFLKARQSHLAASRDRCWDDEVISWDLYNEVISHLSEEVNITRNHMHCRLERPLSDKVGELTDMLEVQLTSSQGSGDDSYMYGVYNGMEFALSIIMEREPKFIGLEEYLESGKRDEDEGNVE